MSGETLQGALAPCAARPFVARQPRRLSYPEIGFGFNSDRPISHQSADDPPADDAVWTVPLDPSEWPAWTDTPLSIALGTKEGSDT
jgi:hypothetical protein